MSEHDDDPAFGTLEDRAQALAGADARDRISLSDHIVSADIGAFQSERGRTQRLAFSIVVELRAAGSGKHDDVDRILSYDTLTAAIAAELAAERLNLLETLAERIAARLLAEPQAARVFVRIEKLDRGPGRLGVEIVRHRTAAETPPAPDRTVNPWIVCLPHAALASPNLPSWLDQLAGAGQGAILILPPASVALETADPAAARQITLLAVEQAGWALAARDARLSVIASRTELDHAVSNGGLAVWAPAHMIADAVPPADIDPADPVALGRWLAARLGGGQIVAIADPDTPHLDLTGE